MTTGARRDSATLQTLLRGAQVVLVAAALLPRGAHALSAKQNAGLSDVFSYIAIFGGFFVFLKYLLSSAMKKILQEQPGPKEDTFLKEHGYTWDYVFVFNVFDEDDKERMTELQREFTMKNVIDRVTAAGVETTCFYSCQRDEIYVKTRVAPMRLKAEAQKAEYKCLLDKNGLRVKAQQGKKTADGSVYIWHPISLTDEFQQSSIQPYDYIYGPYNSAPEFNSLYTVYDFEGKKHPFRQIDRIKLMLMIFQAPLTDSPPGAGLDITQMSVVKKGPVVKGQFPIQNFDELNRLQRRWLTMWDWPWNQPVDGVRDYFGERISFYFLYLGHYTELLLVPAALGAGTYILKCYEASPESTLQPYFTCVMVLWSTYFMETWKAKQSTKGLHWGMHGFESAEQDRPLFEGTLSKSPVDGSEEKYYPSALKAYWQQVVTSIIGCMILGVISVVAAIFTFQWWVSQPGPAAMFTIQGFNAGSIIASIANAAVIGILNALYGGNAVMMNGWENHRTDTQYEDALISKIFIFTLVNSFAALTYVSFIKYFLGFTCIRNNCIGDVATTLSTVFLTALITRAINQVLVQQYTQYKKDKEESGGIEPGTTPSPLEKQYCLAPYDTLLTTLTDYAALTVNYGYTTLFVCAFPLAPTMSCISAYIQIRIDGWKHCQAFQRPTPKSAEDIGVWQDMLEILGFLGVVYNFALLFFTGHWLLDVTWAFRWIMFICVEHVCFVMKVRLPLPPPSLPEHRFPPLLTLLTSPPHPSPPTQVFISAVMSDMPEEVAMQLERTEFLVSKVIEDTKDLLEDEGEVIASTSNIIISQTDFDWVVPEAEEEKDG